MAPSCARDLPEPVSEHVFHTTWWTVDRRYEIEILRRSLAMLTPGVRALTREEALELVEELAEVRSRLDRLEEGLRALLADS